MIRIAVLIAMLLRFEIGNGQALIRAQPQQREINDLVRSLKSPMDDTTRIGILFRLVQYNLEKTDVQKDDLDSAKIFSSQAKEINSKYNDGKWRGQILLYDAITSRKSGDVNGGRELANQAIHHLQTSGDDVHMIQAYLELSRSYDPNIPEQANEIKNVFNRLYQVVPAGINENSRQTCMFELRHFYHTSMWGDGYPIQLHYLAHFVRANRLLKNPDDEFWGRKEIADIHFKQGKITTAIEALLQIAKEQKEGNHPKICFTYDLLAGIYYANGDYDKGLYCALETIKYVKTSLDSTFLHNFYLRISRYYSSSGSTAEALEWNLKALDHMTARNQLEIVHSITAEIADELILLGRPQEALRMVLEKSKSFTPYDILEKRSLLFSLANCYVALKQYNLAEEYCLELLKLTESRIAKKEIAGDERVDRLAASFYLETGQYVKARKYFERTIQQWHNPHTLVDNVYKSNFLFKLDSAKGNYVAAIKHLQNWQLFRDSMFAETKTKAVEELKITYETEKKDQQIQLNEQNIQLLTQQDLLQKSKLQQEAMLRQIGIAVLVLLVIIMALLYNRYQSKRRTNRKLESQQHEISQQNLSLQRLLTEKEWLVKEIHHRVKNNLQIVMSLLNSQTAYIESEPALTAIHDSQHRVHAMSLIHQKLYGSENLSSIDMSVYTREMVSYLADSFDTGQRIRFEYNVEPIEMDVSVAVPLGLILNEAITNALKYAFPEERTGVISILLSKSQGNYLLRISDNGVGLPHGFTLAKSGSLGMSLMQGLTEDLNGRFMIENDHGTIINISFIGDVAVKRFNGMQTSWVEQN